MSIRYSRFLHSAIFLIDWLLLNVILVITFIFLVGHGAAVNKFPGFVCLTNVCWIAVSFLKKSYLTSRPLYFSMHIRRLSVAYLYFIGLIFLSSYALNGHAGRLNWPILFYWTFFLTLIIFRASVFIFLNQIRKRGYNLRHILVIGDIAMYQRVERSLAMHPEYGYHVLGFIPEGDAIKIPGEHLYNELHVKSPDEIFICYKKLNAGLLDILLKFGKQNAVRVLLVTDSLLKDQTVQLINHEKIQVLHLEARRINDRDKILKRSFDILFSLSVIIMGLPIFIVLYLVTKCTSNGPALYQQERLGKNGRPFNIYKFRSMYVNAEKNGPQLTKDNDPRITTWGRFIRKTRLDELPQFWNVLIGDMSVVGPRPERKHFVDKIVERTPEYRLLQHLKPGLTSIGQIRYGYAENIDQMCDRLNYDFLYLKNISLNNDLNIILKTIKVVFQAKGK
ncbi:MAG TPA: sugar transferase [Mucilaginibacter sp.]|jgi:putative colanic acid biosynthesis UDP-glucose lipid carrier transferase|nr:sugar transferase [Mucilaginibacter sp.]